MSCWRRTEKAKGAREPGTNRGVTRSGDTTASLADLGITKDQSSQWQRLAKVPSQRLPIVDATIKSSERERIGFNPEGDEHCPVEFLSPLLGFDSAAQPDWGSQRGRFDTSFREHRHISRWQLLDHRNGVIWLIWQIH